VAGHVDDAHAVGADDPHPRRHGDRPELGLDGPSRLPGLAEPRREDDAETTALRAQRADGGQHRLRREAHEREVEAPGQILDAPDHGVAEDGLAARVDGEHVAREARGDEVLDEPVAELRGIP